ncbi:MAG: hypothetical protein GSR85_06900 [Desulfurococcales archaeon]|nr:hypothetical protein [Desulfurococcales archaeon]
MASPAGDYGYVVEALLSYLRDKGQIPSATALASILMLNDIFRERYGIAMKLDRFIESWVKLSQIEPARWDTVAQRNVEKVAKISAQVNYVEEQASRTKYLPFGRRKKE